MALSFTKLHSPKHEEDWNAKPAKDPLPKLKEKLTLGIDGALASLKQGKDKLKGWYSTKDGVNGVQCQLRLNNRPISAEGRDSWYHHDAAKFYSAAKSDVAAGHMDEVIRASGLSASVVSVGLLGLEMKRMVRQLPGKMFVRVR